MTLCLKLNINNKSIKKKPVRKYVALQANHIISFSLNLIDTNYFRHDRA